MGDFFDLPGKPDRIGQSRLILRGIIYRIFDSSIIYEQTTHLA